jgi:AraC-like DNA-binding protein
MPSTRTSARSAAEPVIRVGGAAALFPLVAQHGVDPHALAAEAGLSVDFFANPDNVVPFAALCRLTQLAAQRTGLGDIGLRACARMGLPALGLLGYLVAHSESVERGLEALQEFLCVHDQGATPYVSREGDSAVLGYEILTPGIPGADQVSFGALAIAANILRGLCGSEFRLQGVTFAYRPPPDVSMFQSIFGAPVRFNAGRTALVFEARWLAVPVKGAEVFIRDILMEKIHQQTADASWSATDGLRRVVRALVSGGKFAVDDLAAALRLNRRTLFRRLRDHGTSFRDLLDDARFNAAKHLLTTSAIPISEIAARLGYSDTATFTRAFGRWAGTAPAEWRSRQRRI